MKGLMSKWKIEMKKRKDKDRAPPKMKNWMTTWMLEQTPQNRKIQTQNKKRQM